jgi:hypothetical protein
MEGGAPATPRPVDSLELAPPLFPEGKLKASPAEERDPRKEKNARGMNRGRFQN